MYQFHTSTITTSNAERVKVISFEHDFLITVTGTLTKVLPMFEKGTTAEEIQKTLGCDLATAESFIKLLVNHQIIVGDKKDNTQTNHQPGAHSFKDYGSVSIEVVEVTDMAVAAAKAVKELC